MWSSVGQPPHALVTFGFGGKLIVMKDTSGGPISVLNMAEIMTGGGDMETGGTRICGYFHTLCRQSFSGPLAGENVGGGYFSGKIRWRKDTGKTDRDPSHLSKTTLMK